MVWIPSQSSSSSVCNLRTVLMFVPDDQIISHLFRRVKLQSKCAWPVSSWCRGVTARKQSVPHAAPTFLWNRTVADRPVLHRNLVITLLSVCVCVCLWSRWWSSCGGSAGSNRVLLLNGERLRGLCARQCGSLCVFFGISHCQFNPPNWWFNQFRLTWTIKNIDSWCRSGLCCYHLTFRVA